MVPYHLPPTITLHKVQRDCKLQQYITKVLSVEFRRGHTYYEFTNEVENIPKGKEVILQDNKKKPATWFRLVQPEVLAAESKELYGNGIACSIL